MKVKHWLGIGLAVLLVLIIAPRGLRWARSHGGVVREKLDFGPGRIAILPVYGEIVDSSWVVKWLKRYEQDVRGVKAVVIALDTPGGGVAPSQEINEAISRLRDNGVVVVASMGSTAASGGYYVAAACDEIVANPGTITGSIGVIMETVHAEDLLKKVGAKFETIKSGEFKDSGSPYRSMNARERALFQAAIDDVCDQFVTAVAEGRHDALAAVLSKRTGRGSGKLSDAEIKAYAKTLADGRIYTGRQALQLGLVDSLGSLDDAIDRAADLAGLDDPEVVTIREPRSFAEVFTGMSKADWKALARSTFQASGPSFKFLYR